MGLKKTLYAMVMLVAVVSMVVPNVYAGGSRAYLRDRTFENNHRAQLQQHQSNPKARNARGNQKALANNGLLSGTPTLFDQLRAGTRQPINVDTQSINPTGTAKSSVSGEALDHLMNPQPVVMTPELRSQLNIRPANAPTETAASRKSRLEKRFAEAKRGLVRGGGASPSAVLPAGEIADDSGFSALAFIGLSGTEDFFDEAVLVGDIDGNKKLENDFDTGNAPRSFIDRQGKVEDDVLLPDEVYTSVRVSGHNGGHSIGIPRDFNVFYTATSAGFLSVLGDTTCDGDLLADTVIDVVAVTSLTNPATGFPFSNSASITGLAVNTDTEYDGDPASDELVWISIFDPETGPNGVSSSLFLMGDSDGDDIPDSGLLVGFATSSRLAIAGVTIDSFGDVYWLTTDRVIGVISKAWDVDEDRIPDVGFANFNAITNLDLFNAANAVDIASDRNDSIFLQIAGTAGIPRPNGLPSHIASYIDRCGDFDSTTGLIPRPDQFADAPFRIYAADADVAQPAGAGDPSDVLVLPGMQIDYSGAYRGLCADYDDNIYVAVGATPAGQSGDPSPFTGAILRIPDNNCDRVGDSVDMDGDSVYGEATGRTATSVERYDDYCFMLSPLNPSELTPNGINGVSFGPLFSLQRNGFGLGDDEGIAFAFDDFDGEANNVAGGATDLLFATECDNVGSNAAGGPVGFEWLFCNTAWTGFRLGSNGNIAFRDDPFTFASSDPLLTDFSPTVIEWLSSEAPQVAPLWADLTPGGGGQFSIHRLGFAATDAFIIQYHNMPAFGLGGVGVGIDPFGFPKRGNTNSFDITFYDDQDAWDDGEAEEEQGGTNDTTNLQAIVNDDNDGNSFPVGIGLRPGDPTRRLDRNGDGDQTDENLTSFAQEGVGQRSPEQGPYKTVYHQMEIIGDAAAPVLVGFTTGFDGVFNTGTIPPGLCETNLSEASPADDSPFFMNGAIGMGTEPTLYEYFNDGDLGGVNPDGTIRPSQIDFDLRQGFFEDCVTRPELFLDDTSADCLLYKGSNIPVGLFCKSIGVTAVGGNDDPFLGPANLQINGFLFPMPTTGENAVCPQFCGQTAPLCRAGKSVTYDVVFKFDEDGDGDIDATISYSEPDVVVTSENQINLTIDFSQTNLCGLSTEVCLFATYGFGDDNKYFELQQLDADAALEVAPVQLTCVDPIAIGPRQPVVLSIAPDEVDCDDPDDPDNVEDVQIAGLCFFNDIESAFLTLNPDGSGTQIPLSNVIHVAANIITATVPLSQLTQRDTPYYVFVVRGDGARSTNYPNPFGFDVTFTCVSTVVPTPGPTLTNCKVVRVSGGKFVLQVNGVGFKPNDTIVLLNGQPCRKNKYPSRFIVPSDGTTTRINCSGGLKRLLPAVVTTRNTSDGVVSQNSLNCDF